MYLSARNPTGEAIEVEAVCTPVQLGRLKDYIVSGWTPPKEPWED